MPFIFPRLVDQGDGSASLVAKIAAPIIRDELPSVVPQVQLARLLKARSRRTFEDRPDMAFVRLLIDNERSPRSYHFVGSNRP